MKKVTAILLTATLTLSLFACGTKPTEINCEGSTTAQLTLEETTLHQPDQPTTTIFPSVPITPEIPTNISEADFFYANYADYNAWMKKYNGFYVTGYSTAWENSEYIALRILSYDKLQDFLADAPSAEATQVLQGYEESFFEENALMLILFDKSSSTSYTLKNISNDERNYMIELKYSKPYMVSSDFTYTMLLIPDKKHNIENANVDMLITVSAQNAEESKNFTFHSTITDICPENMQNAFSRVSYMGSETLFTGYEVKEIDTNFDYKKATLLRFYDYESFLAWQTEALKPLEESGNYGSDHTALATAAQYDEAFFEDNILNIILFNRSSGSYIHKDASAYLCANGKIIVRLTTDTPNMWTTDMATWLLFLPQSAEYENIQIDRIFADFE